MRQLNINLASSPVPGRLSSTQWVVEKKYENIFLIYLKTRLEIHKLPIRLFQIESILKNFVTNIEGVTSYGQNLLELLESN